MGSRVLRRATSQRKAEQQGDPRTGIQMDSHNVPLLERRKPYDETVINAHWPTAAATCNLPPNRYSPCDHDQLSCCSIKETHRSYAPGAAGRCNVMLLAILVQRLFMVMMYHERRSITVQKRIG
jgi:hypothetical protein